MSENTFVAEDLTKELESRGYYCVVEEGVDKDAVIHTWKHVGDETIVISGGIWDVAEPLSSPFTTANQACDVWEDNIDADGYDKGDDIGFTTVDEGSSITEIADIVDEVYRDANGLISLG